jgi:UDP-glucose 4-epimerase
MIAVLGGSGFVGGEVANLLCALNVRTRAFSSKDVDLLDATSVSLAAETLNAADAIVFASAIAPCRTISDLRSNLLMVENLVAFVNPDTHVVYVSSDAVYADTDKPINEGSEVTPISMHGLMHISREFILESHFKSLSVVRPTLIYGKNDPHNGYGPNKFTRKAENNEKIELFGEGEEIRDHIHVNSVAAIISELAQQKVCGVFNAVSGFGITFREVAEIVISITGSTSEISSVERNGPMPHNGLRIFDATKVRTNFPQIELGSFADGYSKY